jgi:hypothetical protein
MRDQEWDEIVIEPEDNTGDDIIDTPEN